MTGIEAQDLRRTLHPLLAWSYSGGRDGIRHTFSLHRTGRPSVALLFEPRPERFPVAALQEAVYAFDPDAVAICAETNLRVGADSRRALLVDVLTRTHVTGTATQDQYAFAVETSPLGIVGLGESIPTAGASDSLLPLAAVPRTDLSEVADRGAALTVPAGAEAAAPADAESRKRLVVELGALRGLATRPRPLPQVVLLGRPAELDLYAANGLDPLIESVTIA